MSEVIIVARALLLQVNVQQKRGGDETIADGKNQKTGSQKRKVNLTFFASNAEQS
jgi:hypothetical protein